MVDFGQKPGQDERKSTGGFRIYPKGCSSMKVAPLPPNEGERLKALLEYKILDTPPEVQFDDLTFLAAHLCETPIALISLIDPNRQWFKSKFGVTVTETSRDIAFCSHAILESDLCVVKDATVDQRFSDNPLVTGDPHIRFYAGAPLRTPAGHNLGTLCVIDRSPRELSSDQREALRALSRQVVLQMELRRNVREREALLTQLREAGEKIKILHGMLPMCASCKKVRDDKGYWSEVERYIRDHSEAEFSHGICPDCLKTLYPELYPRIAERNPDLVKLPEDENP